MKVFRVTVEVSQAAYLKLMAEVQRRVRTEGRGKKYPIWRIVDELLQNLRLSDGPWTESDGDASRSRGQVRRVTVEVGEAAHLKLQAEVARRTRKEGRGRGYPVWRIIDEVLQTLPSPRPARVGRSEEELADVR